MVVYPAQLSRKFSNVESAVLAGESHLRIKLCWMMRAFRLILFKKIADVIDPSTGVIKPKLNPYATIRQALIETDGFDISEGNLVGRDQSFKYLKPITYLS
jgi:hypothetical protein